MRILELRQVLLSHPFFRLLIFIIIRFQLVQSCSQYEAHSIHRQMQLGCADIMLYLLK